MKIKIKKFNVSYREFLNQITVLPPVDVSSYIINLYKKLFNENFPDHLSPVLARVRIAYYLCFKEYSSPMDPIIPKRNRIQYQASMKLDSDGLQWRIFAKGELARS